MSVREMGGRELKTDRETNRGRGRERMGGQKGGR